MFFTIGCNSVAIGSVMEHLTGGDTETCAVIGGASAGDARLVQSGTTEMINPCLTHLHVISLVPWDAPLPRPHMQLSELSCGAAFLLMTPAGCPLLPPFATAWSVLL